MTLFHSVLPRLSSAEPELLEDLPDRLPLGAAQRPAPPDAGNLQVVGFGLDVVGLDHLLPLLPQEAEVEVEVFPGEQGVLPAAVEVFWAGNVERPPLILHEADGPCVQMDDLDLLLSSPHRPSRFWPTFWARLPCRS